MSQMNYMQGDVAWTLPYLGFSGEYDGITVQEVGDVVCQEGRLLTFPNILQHRVQPFELADPSKPGHRKILALFLVDPNIKIISTAHILPQRRDWWSEEVVETGVFNRLPKELQTQVFEHVDFPLGMDEAKEIRLKLMEERKDFVFRQNDAFESISFSLCEH